MQDERGQALDQVAQKGCRTLALGDVQIPTGQGPKQPALFLEIVLPKLSVGIETSRGSPLPK